MTFGVLAKSPSPKYTPENLTSEKMLTYLSLGMEEVRSCIEDATKALAKLEQFKAAVADRLSTGKPLTKKQLKSLKRFSAECGTAIDRDEWPLYQVSGCCEFLLGEEFEMSNGDLYRDGVLIKTREERYAEQEAENNAHAATLEAKIADIDWKSEPKTDDEANFRAEVLATIEARALATGWVGGVFADLGITDKKGGPLTRYDEDLGHLASDARNAYQRAESASQDAEKRRREAMRRQNVNRTIRSLTMRGVSL